MGKIKKRKEYEVAESEKLRELSRHQFPVLNTGG